MTIGEIIVWLLFELRVRVTKEGFKRATEAGIVVEQEQFAWPAIFGIMRTAGLLICEVVREREEDCAGDFAVLTRQLVETLAELARESPKALCHTASEVIDWPIMATRHYPKQADFAKLADRIGLASKTPVAPNKRHTWKPDTALNRYLVDLLVTECCSDGRLLTRETRRYYLDEILMPLFDKVAADLGGGRTIRNLLLSLKAQPKEVRQGSRGPRYAIASIRL